MAQIKVGSFSSNTVTGNQAITGVGFQPKAVIFWHQREWSDGGNNAYDYCFGTATSPTARWVSSSFQSDFNDEAFQIRILQEEKKLENLTHENIEKIVKNKTPMLEFFTFSDIRFKNENIVAIDKKTDIKIKKRI